MTTAKNDYLGQYKMRCDSKYKVRYYLFISNTVFRTSCGVLN